MWPPPSLKGETETRKEKKKQSNRRGKSYFEGGEYSLARHGGEKGEKWKEE